MDYQRHPKIYASKLLCLDLGHALYEPDPLGDYDFVRIGDVGYISEHGKFMKLFNAFSDSGSPENEGLEVPGDFQPIAEEYRKTSKLTSLSPSLRCTGTVRAIGGAVDGAAEPYLHLGAGGSLTLSCESKSGAALITRHPGIRDHSRKRVFMEAYMMSHIKSWLAFARRLGECNRMHDLVFVTERILTGDWANILWDNVSYEGSISFNVGVPNIASAGGTLWGRWEQRTIVPAQQGPHRREPVPDGVEPDLDQCIFLKGIRIAERGFFEKGLHRLKTLSSKEQEQLPQSDELKRLRKEFKTSDVWGPGSKAGAVLCTFDALAVYIFKNSDSEYALMHDTDLYLLRSSEAGSIEEICEKLCNLGEDGPAIEITEHENGMRVGRLCWEQKESGSGMDDLILLDESMNLLRDSVECTASETSEVSRTSQRTHETTTIGLGGEDLRSADVSGCKARVTSHTPTTMPRPRKEYRLRVIRAEDLKWQTSLHSKVPDLYVECKLGDNARTRRTRTAKRNLDPMWDEVIRFTSSDYHMRLEIEVKHESMWSFHPCIGRVEIELADLFEKCRQGLGGEAMLDLTMAKEPYAVYSERVTRKTTGRIFLKLDVADRTDSLASGWMDNIFSRVLANDTPSSITQSITDQVPQIATQRELRQVTKTLVAKLKVFQQVIETSAREQGRNRSYNFVSDAIQINPFLAIALKSASTLSSVVQDVAQVRPEIVHLVHSMDDAFTFVEGKGLKSRLLSLLEPIGGLLKQTIECCFFVSDCATRGLPNPGQILDNIDTEKIDELERALANFKRELESGVVVCTSIVSTRTTRKIDDLTLRYQLNPSLPNTFSRPICFPNTRVRVCQKIIEWVFAETKQNIFWLHGVAGSGKSAVSATIARHFRDMSRLGALLFFEKGKSDPASVIRTIAYGLAMLDSTIGSSILRVLEDDKEIIAASSGDQFRKLLLKPLLSVGESREPVVVILDALDECGTPDTRRGLLELIQKEFPKLPGSFRFLITSRRATDIDKAFPSYTDGVCCMELDHSSPASQRDVLSYLHTEMRRVVGPEVPNDWDWDGKLFLLGNAAGGLFAWASRAVSMVSDSDVPLHTIESLVSDPLLLCQSGLYDLYESVLRDSRIDWGNENARNRFGRVMSLLIASDSLISIAEIDCTLGFRSFESSRLILSRLWSILTYSEGFVSFFHPSLKVYFSSSECSDKPWYIENKATRRPPLAGVGRTISVTQTTETESVSEVGSQQSPGNDPITITVEEDSAIVYSSPSEYSVNPWFDEPGVTGQNLYTDVTTPGMDLVYRVSDHYTRNEAARKPTPVEEDAAIRRPKLTLYTSDGWSTTNIFHGIFQFIQSVGTVNLEDPVKIDQDALQTNVDLAYSIMSHVEPHQARQLERFLRSAARKRGVFASKIFLTGIQNSSRIYANGGGFADVFQGWYNGKLVALKILRIFSSSTMDEVHVAFVNEALVWQKLNHPNVLPFLGICRDAFAPQMALVSHWMEKGNLSTYLKDTPTANCLKLALGVARGLAYLHSLSPQIIHGDLRAVNVLIDDNNEPRIADFGLVKVVDSRALSTATSFNGGGSYRWQSPELLNIGRFGKDLNKPTTKSDVYAFSCVCLEIFTGNLPFADVLDSAIPVHVSVDDGRPQRPGQIAAKQGLTDDVWSIMQDCWKTWPHQRPDMPSVVSRLEEIMFSREASGAEF